MPALWMAAGLQLFSWQLVSWMGTGSLSSSAVWCLLRLAATSRGRQGEWATARQVQLDPYSTLASSVQACGEQDQVTGHMNNTSALAQTVQMISDLRSKVHSALEYPQQKSCKI